MDRVAGELPLDFLEEFSYGVKVARIDSFPACA